MREIIVSAGEAGQRLDRLLARYLREAPKGFLYKMLRKKNITLNGKKASGKELVASGDCVKMFLAEATIDKFRGDSRKLPSAARHSGDGSPPFSVVYEDEHILLVDKPAGMLTQKAALGDISLNEYILGYLLEQESIREEELAVFCPSVCNRLDRNTSGLVIAAKTLNGAQTVSRLLKLHSVQKYYRCIVKGHMEGSARLTGYLSKNERTNRVFVSEDARSGAERPIETEYRTLASSGDLTLLEVHLITGRSHQIRAHLASVGHPIIGDAKYGDAALNRKYRNSHGVNAQLLHAFRLEFPADMEGPLAYLSGRVFCAGMPPVYGELFPDIP